MPTLQKQVDIITLHHHITLTILSTLFSEASILQKSQASFSASASGWGFSALVSGSASFSSDQERYKLSQLIQ